MCALELLAAGGKMTPAEDRMATNDLRDSMPQPTGQRQTLVGPVFRRQTD
jgi:hypothetical protein